MAESIPITGQGSSNTPPSTSTPAADPTQGSVTQGTSALPVEDTSFNAMVQDTLKVYLNNAFQSLNIPKTSENYQKISINLAKKLESWLLSGDEILGEVDAKEYSKHYLDTACARMGIPANTENWREVLKQLGAYNG